MFATFLSKIVGLVTLRAILDHQVGLLTYRLTVFSSFRNFQVGQSQKFFIACPPPNFHGKQFWRREGGKILRNKIELSCFFAIRLKSVSNFDD